LKDIYKEISQIVLVKKHNKWRRRKKHDDN